MQSVVHFFATDEEHDGDDESDQTQVDLKHARIYDVVPFLEQVVIFGLF